MPRANFKQGVPVCRYSFRVMYNRKSAGKLRPHKLTNVTPCSRVLFEKRIASHSASQEIPHLLWNQKVHYLVHQSPPLVPILSLTHPVHKFSSYFPKIHSYTIFPSVLRSSELSLPFKFCEKILYAFLVPLMHTHSPWFHHFITFGEEYKPWSSTLCSLLQLPATSSLLDLITFRKELFSVRWGVTFSRSPNTKAGGPTPVSSLWLLIQYIRNYPPYLEAVSSIHNLRTRHVMVKRDPLNMQI